MILSETDQYVFVFWHFKLAYIRPKDDVNPYNTATYKKKDYPFIARIYLIIRHDSRIFILVGRRGKVSGKGMMTLASDTVLRSRTPWSKWYGDSQ